ncbi:hypothetical protein Hanom_Chr12g01149841 [Helianthus anomalus]
MLPGPSHQPHVAEEDYLRDYPVAHRNAPLVGFEVIKPFIEDDSVTMNLRVASIKTSWRIVIKSVQKLIMIWWTNNIS